MNRLDTTSQPMPENLSRSQLLHFVRSHAPDIRIRKARLEDGRRACLAQFTFMGAEISVESVEDDKVDPDDMVVRRAAWVIQQRLGIPTPQLAGDRTRREQDIVRAAQQGDTALADRLGLDLAISNEKNVSRAPVRARWER